MHFFEDSVSDVENTALSGRGDDELFSVGSVTDDTSVYRVRRLVWAFRRRRVVLGVAILCAVTVVVSVSALAGGGSEDQSISETVSSEATLGSESVTPASTAEAMVWADLTVAAPILEANELGRIPILMYHKIGDDVVPPTRFGEDIRRLAAAGFYPTTIREMATGTMDIPAGRSPVILTFDDSSPTHYKILPDGSIDPDCAVAIMLEAAEQDYWASKASFFPLLYLETSAYILFGQPEYAQEKLQNLAAWGFEIGSHTVDHLNLAKASTERIKQELAESQTRLEELIGGGYEVYTLTPPYGEFPDDLSLLSSGTYEGVSYEYGACLKAAGGYCYSPFSTKFDPMAIPRVNADPVDTVPDLLWYFSEYPELRYVSDGDPDVITIPEEAAVKLGSLRSDLVEVAVRE